MFNGNIQNTIRLELERIIKNKFWRDYFYLYIEIGSITNFIFCLLKSYITTAPNYVSCKLFTMANTKWPNDYEQYFVWDIILLHICYFLCDILFFVFYFRIWWFYGRKLAISVVKCTPLSVLCVLVHNISPLWILIHKF